MNGSTGSGESATTIWFALAANVVIALAKLVGGLIGGSSALLAEAAHSAGDTANQILLLVSLKLGAQAPDEQHPFGHGKERFFWAFVVAVSIFVAGGLFSIGEGTLALVRPKEGTALAITLGVLAFALVADLISFVRAVRHLRRSAAGEQESFLQYVRTSKDPTPKVVFFEDSAAIAGVLIAIGGVLLAHVTGSSAWDAGAAIAIGVLLLATGLELGRQTKGLLIGEAADEEDQEAIRVALEADEAIAQVEQLLTMHVGPNAILVNARVDLVADADARRFEDAVENVRRRLRETVPGVAHLFVEPALRPRRSAD